MGEWPLTTPATPVTPGWRARPPRNCTRAIRRNSSSAAGELAARARASGDATAARAITSLRKPTRAAWVVNRLVRDDPGAAARLAELGAGLQQAGHALDGGRLRELSRQRRELIAALTRQALTGLPDAPGALQEEVAATLSAAVTDPQVAAELAAGALVRPVERAGFRLRAPAPEDERSLAGAPQGQPAPRPADNSKKRATGIEAGQAQPRARRGPGRAPARRAGPGRAGPRRTGSRGTRTAARRTQTAAPGHRRGGAGRARRGAGGGRGPGHRTGPGRRRPAARAATGSGAGRPRGGETRIPCGRQRATGCPPGPRPAPGAYAGLTAASAASGGPCLPRPPLSALAVPAGPPLSARPTVPVRPARPPSSPPGNRAASARRFHATRVYRAILGSWQTR